MNKKLVEDIFLNAGGPHFYPGNRVHNDVLVRLIVEECVNVLEQRADNWRGDDAALESRRAAQAIKEHFGF